MIFMYMLNADLVSVLIMSYNSISLSVSVCLSISLSLLVMTSLAQLIKASEYACTGRYPVQASAMFLNELIISLSFSI